MRKRSNLFLRVALCLALLAFSLPGYFNPPPAWPTDTGEMLFTNNASTKLANSITNIQTTLTVNPGTGSYFPTPNLTSGSHFYVTLVKSNGEYEIVKVTDKTGDVFTIVRAQDGSTARAFSAGDHVGNRVTKGTLDLIAQKAHLSGELAADVKGVQYISGNAAITDHSVSSAGTLKYLIDQTSPDKATIGIPANRTFIIASNLTVPERITLVFQPNGKLKSTNGAVLTLNCYVEAGPSEIFEEDGGTIVGNPKTIAAYAEWFGADSIVDTDGDGVDDDATDDDGPAMESVLALFKRMDGVYGSTYRAKTNVTVPPYSKIDGHGALYHGHSDLAADFVFSALSTGDLGVDLVASQWITIKNLRFDPWGAGGLFYLLGGHDFTAEGIRAMNEHDTENTTVFLFRNCFDFVVRDLQVNQYYEAGTKGIHIASNDTLSGYSVINNFGIYDSIFQAATYKIYLDLDEDGNGTASNTGIIQNCSFLGGTVGVSPAHTHTGYGIYYNSGGFKNLRLVANKSEYNIAAIYLGNDVVDYHIDLDGWNSANALSIFDLDVCKADLSDCTVDGNAVSMGSFNVRGLSYLSSGTPPAGDYWVFKHVDSHVVLDGAPPEVFDTDAKYTVNGMWPGKVAYGTGRIDRELVYSWNKTGNVTLRPGYANYALNNCGATTDVTWTLPSIASVGTGFPVAFVPCESTKYVTVTPNVADTILKYTMAAGDSLNISSPGSPLQLISSTDGWQPVGSANGWYDTLANVVDVSTNNESIGTGDLKSVTIPGGTLGRSSRFRITVNGYRLAGAEMHTNFHFGATVVPVIPTGNGIGSNTKWTSIIEVECRGLEHQLISTSAAMGTAAWTESSTSAEAISGNIIMKLAVVDGATTRVSSWNIEYF